MTVAQCNINKESCKRDNINPLMERLEKFEAKIETKIDTLIATVAKMPMDMLTMNDGRYARKEDLTKQEGLINKVLWTSVTSLIGFLVSVIYILLKSLV